MKYNKVSKYQMNKKNPFIDETIHHVDKGEKVILMGTKSNDLLIDKETGEIKAHSVFAKRIKVDKAQFRKVYVNSLAAWFELSKTGLKVLGYIMSVLKPNYDSFDFDFEDCMEYTKYKSKNSVISGLSELLENRFIARGANPYKYFVNPTIFFNGDRLTFLRHYELKNGNNNDDIKPISSHIK